MAQCQGPRDQMVRFFFGRQLYLVGRCCDNLQSTRGPTQYKSSENDVVSTRNQLMYHFSTTINFYFASFCVTKYIKKYKLARKLLIEQIIEFKSRGPGPLGRTCTPTTD